MYDGLVYLLSLCSWLSTVVNVTESKSNQQNHALILSELLELPFQKVVTDLLELEKQNYLLVVDYYIEIALLKRTCN